MANGPWEREYIQATFLDLSKAYDRVSIPGLIFKLPCLGFSRDSLTWLSIFLADRQQCITVNGYKSPWKLPKSGIPQGTLLGPVLFLVFVNDLPYVMKSFCSIFADDTTAYTIGKDVASFFFFFLIGCQPSLLLTWGGGGGGCENNSSLFFPSLAELCRLNFTFTEQENDKDVDDLELHWLMIFTTAEITPPHAWLTKRRSFLLGSDSDLFI